MKGFFEKTADNSKKASSNDDCNQANNANQDWYEVTVVYNGEIQSVSRHDAQHPFIPPKFTLDPGTKLQTHYEKIDAHNHRFIGLTVPIDLILIHEGQELQKLRYSPSWKSELPSAPNILGFETYWEIPENPNLNQDIVIKSKKRANIDVSFYLGDTLVGRSSISSGTIITPPKVLVDGGYKCIWSGPESAVQDCVWDATKEPVTIHLIANGVDVGSIEYSQDWVDKLPPVPLHKGYVGTWPTNFNFKDVHDDVQLECKYAKIEHRLHIFMGDDLLETRTCGEDESIELPVIDVKKGYRVEWTKRVLTSGDWEIVGAIVPINISVPKLGLKIQYSPQWKRRLPHLEDTLTKKYSYVYPLKIGNEDIVVEILEKEISSVKFFVDGICVDQQLIEESTVLSYPAVEVCKGRKLVWCDKLNKCNGGAILGHTEPIYIRFVHENKELKCIKYTPDFQQFAPYLPNEDGFEIYWDMPPISEIGNEDVYVHSIKKKKTFLVEYYLDENKIDEKEIEFGRPAEPPNIESPPGYYIEWDTISNVTRACKCIGVKKPILLSFSFNCNVVKSYPYSPEWREDIPPCPTQWGERHRWILPNDNEIGNKDLTILSEVAEKVSITYVLDGRVVERIERKFGSHQPYPVIRCPRGVRSIEWPDVGIINDDCTITGIINPITLTFVFKSEVIKCIPYSHNWRDFIPVPPRDGRMKYRWDLPDEADIKNNNIQIDAVMIPPITITFVINNKVVEEIESAPGDKLKIPLIPLPQGVKKVRWPSPGAPTEDCTIVGKAVPISITFKHHGEILLVLPYCEDWTTKLPPRPKGAIVRGHWNIESRPETMNDDQEFVWIKDPSFQISFVVDDEEICTRKLIQGEPIVPPLIDVPDGYRMEWDCCCVATCDKVITGTKKPISIVFKDGENVLHTMEYSRRWMRQLPEAVDSRGVESEWDIPEDLTVAHEDVIIQIKTQSKSEPSSSSEDGPQLDSSVPSWMRRYGNYIVVEQPQTGTEQPVKEDSDPIGFSFVDFEVPEPMDGIADNSELMMYYSEAGYLCRSSRDCDICNLPKLIETVVNICDDPRIDWYSRTLCNYALSSTLLYDLRKEDNRAHVLWVVCKIISTLEEINSDIVLENTSQGLDFSYIKAKVPHIVHTHSNSEPGFDVRVLNYFTSKYHNLSTTGELEKYHQAMEHVSEIYCYYNEVKRIGSFNIGGYLKQDLQGIFADLGMYRKQYPRITETYVPLRYFIKSYRCRDNHISDPWEVFTKIYGLRYGAEYPKVKYWGEPDKWNVVQWDLISYYIGFDRGIYDDPSFEDIVIAKYLDARIGLFNNTSMLNNMPAELLFDSMSRTGVNLYLQQLAVSTQPTYEKYIDYLDGIYKQVAALEGKRYVSLKKVEDHIRAEAKRKLLWAEDVRSPAGLMNRDVNRRRLDDILGGNDD